MTGAYFIPCKQMPVYHRKQSNESKTQRIFDNTTKNQTNKLLNNRENPVLIKLHVALIQLVCYYLSLLSL